MLNPFRKKTPIELKKAELKKAVLRYRNISEKLLDGHGGGYAMGEILRPGLAIDRRETAKTVNKIAKELQAIDPDFPKSWRPFDES